ncbi:uncharacterized protein LOC131220275 [Magnolia sinica]|uniref:uncharacterized protein LOC131220275 n=1 Tax=Magnolia sinica TaxID=86752 RepID=UPI0026597B5F|nr:uncharacterized protein LOC131220275 [Magnolia sinica]
MQLTATMTDFQEAIHDMGLMDTRFSGSPFTWCNNRAGRSKRWARLDRILINSEWMRGFPNCKVQHVMRSHSDHSPILLSSQADSSSFPHPFRFQRMWTTHDDFLATVKNSWDNDIVAMPMFKFFIKMKNLKAVLRSWNRNSFGDISKKVQEAENETARAEVSLLLSNSKADAIKLNLAHVNLKKAYLQEQIFWKQKSRISWLAEGDRNTRFFHDTVIDRHRRLEISELKSPTGETIETIEDISEEAIRFFQEL